MSLLQKFFPTVAAVAATVAFALALVWYLYRYFSTARVSARPEPRKGLPVWQAFLWVLAAVVLSRLLLWLGGLAGAWLFCKRRRLSFDTLGRDLVPALPLFHAFGRVGCFLAGCCYGIPAPAGWLGVTFPASAIEAPSGVPLLPVQLYEAAGCVLLFLLLDHLTDRGWPGGRLLALYLALYAVFRFLLEFLRGDAVRGSLGPLSTSQVISLAVLAGVLLAELLHHRRNIRQRP